MTYSRTDESLPRRNEYVCGGFGGLRHIVVNYHTDGSVTHTINSKDYHFATTNEHKAWLEIGYQDYLKWLDYKPSWWMETLAYIVAIPLRIVIAFCNRREPCP